MDFYANVCVCVKLNEPTNFTTTIEGIFSPTEYEWKPLKYIQYKNISYQNKTKSNCVKIEIKFKSSNQPIKKRKQEDIYQQQNQTTKTPTKKVS